MCTSTPTESEAAPTDLRRSPLARPSLNRCRKCSAPPPAGMWPRPRRRAGRCGIRARWPPPALRPGSGPGLGSIHVVVGRTCSGRPRRAGQAPTACWSGSPPPRWKPSPGRHGRRPAGRRARQPGRVVVRQPRRSPARRPPAAAGRRTPHRRSDLRGLQRTPPARAPATARSTSSLAAAHGHHWPCTGCGRQGFPHIDADEPACTPRSSAAPPADSRCQRRR